MEIMRKTSVSEVSLKDRLKNIIGIEIFQRVDDSHILDLYIGKDSFSQDTLLLISDTEPVNIFSAQIIQVNILKRNDGKWSLSFSLLDNNFEDLFCHFCEDMIKSSRLLADKKQGSYFICDRYVKWQNMLTKYKYGLLSETQIKGLIGELYFLKNILIPLHGEKMAVYSWIGPEKTDQDFMYKDFWYEVKSTVSGAGSIKISTIEQLDTNREGELVVIYLDKTSYADERKITLNSIYHQILDSLLDDNLKYKLNDILLNMGYCERNEYNEYLFKFSGLVRYAVNKEFPCIRRSDIPDSIINTKYELSLPSIHKYIKESNSNGVE